LPENSFHSMHRLVRTLLLWFMIAALPLQGIAAAANITCGPAHHEMTQPSVPATSSQAALNDSHEHHDMAMMHEHSVADPAPGSHKHSSSFCSSCAACCVGAVAPPVSLKQPSLPSLSETAYIPAAVPVAEFIQAGPERPPRHFSA
jgi:hypothetical protein